ncbi:type I restriction endonuclease subunit R [Geobacillus stearothermophilus]|uniref:type I restriction endonuclease subunit R n=1 Tax=Geobacillus stearothermophilus TaxID=1422 RepID=UPI003D1F807E
MSEVSKRERATQNRVIELFVNKLGYKYLGNWHERENNSNIEEELLKSYLHRKGYREYLINRAVAALINTAGNQVDKLYYVNKDVYTLLRYGAKIKESAGDDNETVHFINWDEPYDNDFYIAEEVTIKGEHNKRPDIVLYINGIAIAVLELKRSTVSVSEGIRQNLDNQQSYFIRHFFNTIQLVMAGNDTEGLRYGTIETPEKYYLTWKEDEKATDQLSKKIESLCQNVEYSLDRHLIGLCQKERLIEILHDFIVFDRGIKKVCRPNQYFGVKAAQKNVKKHQGGIIWHTQGSGKSLTMVWLAKWIRENIPDSRLLIITDRDELDKQIEKVFKGVDEDIYRTKSGKDLIEKLNKTRPLLMCSLIHKFGGKNEDESYEDYIQEVSRAVTKDFKAKGDIYVFVDECHRTQSGKLHDAMKAILPDALFIGFTGTPLLKKDKKKSVEVFGPYIHTYKYDEAVKDGVVLDLVYEARDVDQNITSQEKIDEWFEVHTKGLTEYGKAKLKKHWGTMQRVLSSESRLEKIVNDIIFDMATRDRLQNGRGNAMLVAGSIYEACKYYELFQAKGFNKCAIVSSYRPDIQKLKGESTGENGETEEQYKYKIYTKMLNGKDPETFEEEVKKQFVNEPAQMKLLIVVDKLLTGFDAPPATYLYIDKKMQDHGLFQAICRVNRLDGEDKEYGYIIDYKDLFKSLQKSIKDYTSGAFEGYDEKDIKGVLKDRIEKARERLENALEAVRTLCEPVEPPKDTLAFIRYFGAEDTSDKNALLENEQKRLTFYKLTASLVRAYSNIANEMEKAGYTAEEAEAIRNEVEFYETRRKEVMLNAGDYIQLKAYEPAMRHLIDNYVSAEDSKKISAFEDISLVDLIVEKGIDAAIGDLPKGIRNNKEAVAETIENNVRKLIVDEMVTNPKYYESMSILLKDLIKKRKAQVINYENYLKEIADLAKKVKKPGTSSRYPQSINTPGKRALYDNLNGDEDLALKIHNAIQSNKPDNWRSTIIKKRVVKNIIREYLQDEEVAEKIFDIVSNNQGEY